MRKSSPPRINEMLRYALLGAIFGTMFPLVGTSLEIIFSNLPFNIASILLIQSTTPLLWIIDTAPVVIGLFAGYAGRKQDALIGANEQLVERENKLKDNQVNLEQHIIERTAELVLANQRNERRTSQLEAIAYIARTINSIQTLSELLPQISQTISERLGYYHVGIFLMDDNKEYAILESANSEGGKKMLERSHRLPVGKTGIVGFVTSTGHPRIAMDVDLDTTHFDNPDLPGTRSEIALPLRVGTNVFGALDVQSTEVNAFSQEDVNTLSVLADLVGIAIQNARSYSQIQEVLAQTRAASARTGEQDWRQFLKNESVEGYYFDGVDTKGLQASNLKQLHSLSIPLVLRGTHIGTIKLSSTDPNRMWTEDEIDITKAVAERASIALENARLLQEAQKMAAKERTIGEISAKLGSLSDLESLVQTTIQELGNTLPDTDIAIQFSRGREVR